VIVVADISLHVSLPGMGNACARSNTVAPLYIAAIQVERPGAGLAARDNASSPPVHSLPDTAVASPSDAPEQSMYTLIDPNVTTHADILEYCAGADPYFWPWVLRTTSRLSGGPEERLRRAILGISASILEVAANAASARVAIASRAHIIDDACDHSSSAFAAQNAQLEAAVDHVAVSKTSAMENELVSLDHALVLAQQELIAIRQSAEAGEPSAVADPALYSRLDALFTHLCMLPSISTEPTTIAFLDDSLNVGLPPTDVAAPAAALFTGIVAPRGALASDVELIQGSVVAREGDFLKFSLQLSRAFLYEIALPGYAKWTELLDVVLPVLARGLRVRAVHRSGGNDSVCTLLSSFEATVVAKRRNRVDVRLRMPALEQVLTGAAKGWWR
jgi:hypothetical protein